MTPGPLRRRVYLDTSAYLCVLLGQDGWEKVHAELERSEVISSVLLVLETRRNLARLARDGSLTQDAYQACLDRLSRDIERLELCDVTLDLCDSTVMPAVATPRSLDLAHLRTALRFHNEEPLARFVTADIAQARAARELGLPV
jgi:predicted nucleic acid-binding protein